ncbi:MAG TPA: hypothetical protein DDZ66_14615 [Firmicutes bacterium]|nr:hypothetical protein [Bacillota bacterium]
MARRGNRGVLLVVPSLILIFMFLVFPFFYSLYYSVHQTYFFTVGRFSGLSNFIEVLGNLENIKSLGRTLVLTFSSAAITLVLGILLALWVNKKTGITALVIQSIGLIPWVTSMVVGALLWRWIFIGDLGLFNYIVVLLGGTPISLLSNAKNAMMSLIYVVSWRTIGYAMVLLLAGLKAIPEELYEASEIDGATKLQSLTYITLPLLRTSLLVTAIVLTLSNFNNMTVPMVLTGGGPGRSTNVISMELYRQAFVYYDFGIASAMSSLVFFFNTALVLLYVRLVKWSV